MIIGIGTDITEIARIDNLLQKFGERFLKKIFTPKEIIQGNTYRSNRRRSAFFAKRFSAKESVSKAFGIGIGSVLSFRDIEITNNQFGMPLVNILNKKSLFLKKEFACKNFIVHLSLSDEKDFAISYVTVEKIN